MNPRLTIIHLFAIIFFGLIFYGLIGNIAVKSTVGIILANISLGAIVVFLYLLPKLFQQPNQEEGSEK